VGQKYQTFRWLRTSLPHRDIRKNPRSMCARVPQTMAQFVLKIEKLSHIMGTAPIMISARLRSPSPIMAPVDTHFFHLWTMPKTPVPSSYNSFDPSNLNFQRMTTKTGYEASLCRYLRVTDWEYREWLDRFEKSEILKLCSKNTFRELLSKILFRVS